jgi:hypothetical protein
MKQKRKKTRAKKTTARKTVQPADHLLRKIPANVQRILSDLQAQIQSGAVEISDWKSLGLAIMNRLGKVSASLKQKAAGSARSVKSVGKRTKKRAGNLRPWAR